MYTIEELAGSPYKRILYDRYLDHRHRSLPYAGRLGSVCLLLVLLDQFDDVSSYHGENPYKWVLNRLQGHKRYELVKSLFEDWNRAAGV
jgi:hypothetical protein